MARRLGNSPAQPGVVEIVFVAKLLRSWVFHEVPVCRHCAALQAEQRESCIVPGGEVA